MRTLRALVTATVVSAVIFASAACSLFFDPDDLTRDRGQPFADAEVSDSDAATSYAATVLTDSPLGFYRFDEAADALTAKDSSGHAHDCAYAGGVERGRPGAIVHDASTSIHLSGQGSYVDCGTVYSFDGDVPFSIEVWLGIDVDKAFDATYRRIFSREGSDPNAQQGYGMLFHREDRLLVELERWDVSSGKTTFSGGTFDGVVFAAGFNHLVVTYGNGHVRIFLNDTVVADQDSAGTVHTTDGNFVIGATSYNLPEGAGGFIGDLDEIAIYDHVLTAERVAEHYRVGTGH